MTPNHTADEVVEMQAAAREALAASHDATGLEKLRLINLAFPFAIQGSGQGLLIAWAGDGWSISDTGGFITKLERDDVVTMLVMIGMEAGRRGSVRETITGEERKAKVVSLGSFHSERGAKPDVKSDKPTLADLGLEKKDERH